MNRLLNIARNNPVCGCFLNGKDESARVMCHPPLGFSLEDTNSVILRDDSESINVWMAYLVRLQYA